MSIGLHEAINKYQSFSTEELEKMLERKELEWKTTWDSLQRISTIRFDIQRAIDDRRK